MAGEYIAALYNKMEEEVIADIARRVRKTDRFTETAEIMAKALRAQGYSPDRIQVEVMKKLNTDNVYLQYVANETRAYKQEVKQIIAQTVADAAAAGDALTAAAGEMSWNDDLQVWADHGVDLKKDNTLRQIQQAFTDQTVGELKNITRTTALQIGGVPILDAYHHELDLAIVKIASGAFTFGQAMDDCCRRLGGGAQVIYPSGRKYSIEAAARMTLKTGLSQMAGRITERNIEKTGVDFVFVQAHAGARPEHAEWQGKVYTYKGKPSEEYPDFFEATGYGTVTGLKGVNCSHEFYPWWPGDPIPEFKEPEPVTIDGKEYSFYEATQEQRKMERDVRNMKREAAAAKAAGNTEKAEKLEAKIKETRREYTDFSKAAGLRPKTERMKIYDGSTTQASEAAAAYKRKSTVNASIRAKDIATGLDEKMQQAIYKAEMEKMQKELSKKFTRENKWNRNLKIENMSAAAGKFNPDKSITLAPDSTLATRYHELLHGYSADEFQKYYNKYKKLEEGPVDLLSNILAVNEGGILEIAYEEEVKALRSIIKTCKIEDEEKFLIDLIDTPLNERAKKLADIIDERAAALKLGKIKQNKLIKNYKELL